MGNLILSGNNVTMTSLEIVDFINDYRKVESESNGYEFPCEKFAKLRHDHFMDKVPDVLGGLPLNRETYRHPQNGQIYGCYRFQKREACLMAMSYSYELQAAVFDHMTALENQLQPAFKIPQTYAEALVVAGQQAMLAEERQAVILQQTKELTLAAPKVEYVNKYVERENLKSLTDVAKELGISGKALGLWLRENGHAWKKKDKMVWTQPFIDNGYGASKQFSTVKGYDGTQALITAKGDLFIKESFGK